VGADWQEQLQGLFLLETATDGAAIGTDNIQLSFDLDPEARTLSGAFQDTADTVLVCRDGQFRCDSHHGLTSAN
jgi:hypothetical protein